MIVASIFVVLASLLHVFIWYLESCAWTTRARKVFGTSEAEAEATKEMAFNQGFTIFFSRSSAWWVWPCGHSVSQRWA